MTRLRQAIAAIFLSAGIASSLPSDALLDSLALAAADHERAGKLGNRDQTEILLETLARQRIAADSAPEHPKEVLSQLDRLREERAHKEEQELESRRKPPPEVASMLAADSLPASVPGAARNAAQLQGRPADSAATTTKSVISICSTGPVRIEWLQSTGSSIRDASDSIHPVKVRIDAPCGLSRIDLFVDETLLRSFPVPMGKVGAFEFSDGVALTAGVHHLDIVACDSFGVCSRSVPLESRTSKPVPPWIPRAVGALVGLCVLLGLALAIRKRASHPAPVHHTATVPLPDSTGVSSTIRHRLQLVAKEIGPSFPAVSLRLPDAPPALSIDPESLGEAFGTIVRLHARRSQQGGQILIAMGHGPLSAEMVFEDTAASPDEQTIPSLLDPSKPRLKERMELDQELELARQAIVRATGSISMEARIDGGLRTRVRLKLAPNKDKT